MSGFVTTVFDVFKTGLPGFAIVGVALVVYYAVKHGVPATIALFKSDVAAIEARLAAVEAKLGIHTAPGPTGVSGATGSSH